MASIKLLTTPHTLIDDLTETGQYELKYLLPVSVMLRVVGRRMCRSHARLPNVLTTVQTLQILMLVL